MARPALAAVARTEDASPTLARQISTRYRPLDRISTSEVREMHRLFSRYYEHASFETFVADLKRKSGAFLVRRKADGRIVGFSTLAIHRMEVDGRPIKELFSGDTILEKEYWGNRAFSVAFLLRLVIEALKNPFTPQYWFLISKGFKTYLLLSKNFPDYYPRRDREDDGLRRIVEAYCEMLFPGVLDRRTMLLDFGAGYNRLRAEVALLTPALCRREPDVAFFEQRNPSWRRGTELPTVGRADLLALVKLAGLQIWKALFKPSRCGRDVQESVGAKPEVRIAA
jgi:hypothetical protein